MISVRWVLAPALVLVACGGGPTCKQDPRLLKTEAMAGSVTVARSGEGVRQRLRVTLRGLPDIWPAESPIRDAVLTTSVVAQGQTRAPQIVVGFGDEAPSGDRAGASTVPIVSSPLFDCAKDPDADCCQYGFAECSVTGTLFILRVDGAAVPSATIDWMTEAKVTVDQCPLSSTPVLELTSEEVE